MASFNELLSSPSAITTTRASHASCVVTVTAPGTVRGAIAIFGILITASAVPAAAVEATLTDGTTTLTINLPATIFPAGFIYNFPSGHPWVAAAGANVVLTVPDLGAAPVICNASLMWRGVAAL